jgi:imidazolonepropionase-like amidohydrolase
MITPTQNSGRGQITPHISRNEYDMTHLKTIFERRICIALAHISLISSMLLTCSHETTLTESSNEGFAELTDTPVVAVLNVNVIPMDEERIVAGQNVVIRDGLITDIGPVDQVMVPDSALEIDGTGRYLMPGLADMHIHIGGTTTEVRNDHILYLANGITTVREMWGDQQTLAEREAGASGLFGPTIYAASPGMDGPGGPWAGFTAPITSVDQAISTVRQHHAAGFDFIKVYNLLAPAIYQAIVDEATALDIRVVGHVPQAVGLEASLAAQQASMEHLLGFSIGASSTGSIINGTMDLARVRALAEISRDAAGWHTPTLFVTPIGREKIREIRSSPEFRYLSPSKTQSYFNGFFQGLTTSLAQRAEANMKAVTKIIRNTGGNLLLGTDAGFGYMIPGFSIHDELRIMFEAGLTPYEVLSACTSDAARFLQGQDLFGTVAVGMRADLLLLESNPLENLDNVRNRVGVMVRGQWLPEEWLQTRLREIAASYGN